MYGVYLFVAGISVSLAAGAVWAGWRHIDRLGQRVTALEQALTAARQPATRHEWRALERHDIGEAALFDLAEARCRVAEMQAYLEQAIARMEHVAAGGHPDDPRSQWRTLRKD